MQVAVTLHRARIAPLHGAGKLLHMVMVPAGIVTLMVVMAVPILVVAVVVVQLAHLPGLVVVV
jgi:hypothetical protein